jgi:hypothetical protein
MGRRGGRYTLRCHFEGCRETGFFEYDSQRELSESLNSAYFKNWMCSRHNAPHKNLTHESTAKTAVLVATRSESGGQYWRLEGATTGSGVDSSSAHKAYAGDFPEGTRLVITAYVETPEQAAIATEVDGGVPS